MAKTISLTKGQFLTLSETQSKILLAEGYSITIEDCEKVQSYKKTETTTKVVDKPTTSTTPKINHSSKKSNKSSKTSSTKGKKKNTKKAAITFGNVKPGDFFANYDLTNKNKPVLNCVGKCSDVKDNIVYIANSDKSFGLENCSKITKYQFGRFGKSKKVQSDIVTEPSTATRLNEHDFTVVMAYLAKKQDKKVDFVEKAKDTMSKKELANIRKDIRKALPDFKLTAAEAVKEFAALAK